MMNGKPQGVTLLFYYSANVLIVTKTAENYAAGTHFDFDLLFNATNVQRNKQCKSLLHF